VRPITTGIAVLALFAAACGGGPTSPSSNIPKVAGSYSGNVSITFPELGQQLSCTGSTAVTQTGASINIAPIVLRGSCGNMSLPIGEATIDTNGSLGSETGSFYDSSCGGTYNYSASGGFFGSDLRMSLAATSGVCYNMNMTITLTR
jgi:hypothetical protein